MKTKLIKTYLMYGCYCSWCLNCDKCKAILKPNNHKKTITKIPGQFGHMLTRKYCNDCI